MTRIELGRLVNKSSLRFPSHSEDKNTNGADDPI
jgi:hypothetical protein